MISQKFTDIKLDEADLAYIEAQLEEYNLRVYGGDMDAHSRRVYRDMLTREFKENVWQQRDYTYGRDEGLDYKGDVQE